MPTRTRRLKLCASLLVTACVTVPQTLRLESPFGELVRHRTARLEITGQTTSGAPLQIELNWKKGEFLETRLGHYRMVVTPSDTFVVVSGACINLADSSSVVLHDTSYVVAPPTPDARQRALATLRWGVAEPMDLQLEQRGDEVDGMKVNRYRGEQKGIAARFWIDSEGVVRRQESSVDADAGSHVAHTVIRLVALDEDLSVDIPPGCTVMPDAAPPAHAADAGLSLLPSPRDEQAWNRCRRLCEHNVQCDTCFSHARPGGPRGAGTEEYQRCSAACYRAVADCESACLDGGS